MSDTPCQESDLHPHPGDMTMKFKVEYTVIMSADDAKDLAEDEGTEDNFPDDPTGTTAENIQSQIENSSEFEWQPDNVKVNSF